MDLLTDDLRQLVVSGDITYSQAETMNVHNDTYHKYKKNQKNKSHKKKQGKKKSIEEPLRQLNIQAIGQGTGAVGDLPDDIYGVLLSFCNFEQLVLLGSTCKFLGTLALNDVLWERLYLQRWKRPKPPSAGANCPRYHLTYYQLYARRIILGAIRLSVEFDEFTMVSNSRSNISSTSNENNKLDKKPRRNVASHTSNSDDEGNNSAYHAIVAVRHIGEGHIVTAGIDGVVNSWNLQKMECLSSLSAHDALKHQDKQIALEKKVESLDQAWKNKLMTFKIKKNMSPRTAARKKMSKESETGEIDIWGDANDLNANLNENNEEDDFDGMFNFEQDAGYTNNNINLSSSSLLSSSTTSPIYIPIKNHNADYRHDLIPSPTSSGHISFSDGSDGESSSDTSTDANDIYGSSVDSNTPSTFCVGSLGSSPGLSTNFMMSNMTLSNSSGKKSSKKKNKREQKRLEKLRKKEARKAKADAKRREKEAKKLERQRKRASSIEQQANIINNKQSSAITPNKNIPGDFNANAKTPTHNTAYGLGQALLQKHASPIEIFEQSPLHRNGGVNMTKLGTSPIDVRPIMNNGIPSIPTLSRASSLDILRLQVNGADKILKIPRSVSPSNGKPMLHRASTSPPTLSRSNSYTHSIKKKKKKGKRGGKQNAMQQSRDARVRKMKADMEERRKKRDEKLNNSSGGDSGSENGGSDTESFGSNDHGERTKAANSRPMRCPLMFISNHHIRPKGEDDAKEEYRLNPRVVAVFQNSQAVTFTAPLHDPATIDVALRENETKIMNEVVMPRTFQRPRWLRPEHWIIQCVAITVDDKVVLGHSGDGHVGTSSLTVWDATTGKNLHTMYGLKGAPSALVALDTKIHSNDAFVVSGDSQGDLRLWNATNGIFVESGLACGRTSEALPLQRNGKMITKLKTCVSRVEHSLVVTVVAGNLDGHVFVWHGESRPDKPALTFKKRGTFTSSALSAVRSIAMATWQRPLLRMIAFGSDDGNVRLWELPAMYSTDETGSINPLEDKVIKAAAMVDDSGKKKAWDKLLKGHDGSITALKIDLTKVTSASVDGSVKLWEVVGKHAGRCLRTLKHPKLKMPALSLSVGALSITVGYRDGSVYMFSFGKNAKEKKRRSEKPVIVRKLSYSNRKGGVSPNQRNSLRNKKYARGGNRRGLRDLQAKCKDLSRLNKQLGHCFEFDDEEL